MPDAVRNKYGLVMSSKKGVVRTRTHFSDYATRTYQGLMSRLLSSQPAGCLVMVLESNSRQIRSLRHKKILCSARMGVNLAWEKMSHVFFSNGELCRQHSSGWCRRRHIEEG